MRRARGGRDGSEHCKLTLCVRRQQHQVVKQVFPILLEHDARIVCPYDRGAVPARCNQRQQSAAHPRPTGPPSKSFKNIECDCLTPSSLTTTNVRRPPTRLDPSTIACVAASARKRETTFI